MYVGGDTKVKKTKCANCGKVMFTYMTDQQGNIPTVFCDNLCESEFKNPQLKGRYGRKRAGQKGS